MNNDYNRYTIIYLMTNKSEVPGKIKDTTLKYIQCEEKISVFRNISKIINFIVNYFR